MHLRKGLGEVAVSQRCHTQLPSASSPGEGTACKWLGWTEPFGLKDSTVTGLCPGPVDEQKSSAMEQGDLDQSPSEVPQDSEEQG